MATTTPARKGRYVTISVRPETWQELIAMLQPRETMDLLVARLILGYQLREADIHPLKEEFA